MSTLVFTAAETFLWRKGDPFNFISPAPPPCSRRPKRRDTAKKELADVLRAYPAIPCHPLHVDSCCRRCSYLVSLESYAPQSLLLSFVAQIGVQFAQRWSGLKMEWNTLLYVTYVHICDCMVQLCPAVLFELNFNQANLGVLFEFLFSITIGDQLPTKLE